MIGKTLEIWQKPRPEGRKVRHTRFWQPASKEGVVMRDLLTLIVAPCVVGIVLALFSDWLDRKQ